ncbi:hypothetical protein ACQEVF_40420 [Nonomuraea polychroma]|uniref:hypothetical protein n=1 Tax=Nonomuraea polychroma TaxID=46176 RepID=UPI003D8C7D88
MATRADSAHGKTARGDASRALGTGGGSALADGAGGATWPVEGTAELRAQADAASVAAPPADGSGGAVMVDDGGRSLKGLLPLSLARAGRCAGIRGSTATQWTIWRRLV